MKAPAVYVAEPPVAYRVRTPVVVDCSIFGALLFDETLREAAAQLVAGRSLHAPWLLDHEIANVVDKKRRAGLPPERVDAGLALYEEHEVTMHRVAPADALALAAAYSISTHDAAYLAVAVALKVPLVTFDHKLGRAAVRHLGSLE
ncbi:MAG: type II toxin-antitoxin system VapC family toxin [Pseudomonadota bacterium]|nr:type II toxin-antitoxin system VapC family toxin [Pseudomonadota bacterium]